MRQSGLHRSDHSVSISSDRNVVLVRRTAAWVQSKELQ